MLRIIFVEPFYITFIQEKYIEAQIYTGLLTFPDVRLFWLIKIFIVRNEYFLYSAILTDHIKSMNKS